MVDRVRSRENETVEPVAMIDRQRLRDHRTHRVAKKDDGAARRRRAGPVDEREKVGLDTREPAFAIVAERGCRERILAMPAMVDRRDVHPARSEEHTSELQSLMRISYAVFCLQKKKTKKTDT